MFENVFWAVVAYIVPWAALVLIVMGGSDLVAIYDAWKGGKHSSIKDMPFCLVLLGDLRELKYELGQAKENEGLSTLDLMLVIPLGIIDFVVESWRQDQDGEGLEPCEKCQMKLSQYCSRVCGPMKGLAVGT